MMDEGNLGGRKKGPSVWDDDKDHLVFQNPNRVIHSNSNSIQVEVPV